jgi:two-component system cell cycle response regulator
VPGDSCLRNANIIVADNDRIARKYVSKLLRNMGAQVMSVADGESAIQAVRKGPVDLVVLDAQVPGLSALETSRAIRTVSRNGFLPIFLLTEGNRLEGRLQGLRMGADEFMPKPFEDVEFLVRVRTMLRSRSEARAGQDEVTQLPDQRHFRARVEQEIEHAERHLDPFACCMVTVDDFRELISELGATRADASLLAVSQLLLRHTRATDLVTRFRTAEFGLLLPKTSLAGALTLADRILGAMCREQAQLGRTKPARVSIGVGTYPDPKLRTAAELISSASIAVARARSVGPNHICCLQQPGYLFRPSEPKRI